MRDLQFDTLAIMPIPKVSEITTTVATEKDAIKMADAIVGSGLAACVQFWPIRSVYRWRGKIESGREFRLSCKTRATRVSALIEFIRVHHSYEVPEVMATTIEGGLPAYLKWIDQETRRSRLTFSPPPTRKRVSRRCRTA
jgi:periplasmic divalent cation tolerance protein